MAKEEAAQRHVRTILQTCPVWHTPSAHPKQPCLHQRGLQCCDAPMCMAEMVAQSACEVFVPLGCQWPPVQPTQIPVLGFGLRGSPLTAKHVKTHRGLRCGSMNWTS